MKYRQCILKKENVKTTSWIPAELVSVGCRLKLKNGDNWDTGWKIISAGEPKEGKLIENQAHNCASIWEPSAKITTRGNK